MSPKRVQKKNDDASDEKPKIGSKKKDLGNGHELMNRRRFLRLAGAAALGGLIAVSGARLAMADTKKKAEKERASTTDKEQLPADDDFAVGQKSDVVEMLVDAEKYYKYEMPSTQELGKALMKNTRIDIPLKTFSIAILGLTFEWDAVFFPKMPKILNENGEKVGSLGFEASSYAMGETGLQIFEIPIKETEEVKGPLIVTLTKDSINIYYFDKKSQEALEFKYANHGTSYSEFGFEKVVLGTHLSSNGDWNFVVFPADKVKKTENGWEVIEDDVKCVVFSWNPKEPKKGYTSYYKIE